MEITRLGDFKKLDMIRDLIFLLISRTGSKLDINKISSELGVSRETVSNYISFLENTFFIKLISPFTKNKDVEIKSQKKVYICDTGFINEFGRVSEGVVFENAVFLSLYRIGDVNYYRKKSGVEIDFILNKEIAYETKLTPTLSDLKRLDRLKKELRLKDYYIVSRRFSELDRIKYGFEL
jgi:predicted AAA+ superfamily ATPase